MQKNQKQISESLIDYIPAQLSEGKSWYIVYHVKHPESNVLVRRRMRVNRIKSITERRKHCKRIISNINAKLETGWNPFLEDVATGAFAKFSDVITIYLNSVERTLSSSSYLSYKSQVNKFKKWLDINGRAESFVINFSPKDARAFMRFLETDYQLSGLSYNNNKTQMVSLFNWMKDGDYIRSNPFSGIKKKPVGHKKRQQFITKADRLQIVEHFEDKNPQMTLFIKLMYHCLIRPKELTNVKLEYIDLQKQTIFIPGQISKNGKDRYATIPNVLMPYFIKQNYDLLPKFYLFGKGDMKPSSEHIDTRRVGDKWRLMRQTLGFDNTLHIYSLRDTGIIQKLKDGISPDEVMYQADHSSLEITNKYVRIANPKIFEQIKTKASAF